MVHVALVFIYLADSVPVCFITEFLFVSFFLHTMRQQVYMTLRTDWLVRVRRKLIPSVAIR
jgi:hypothetical protein